jgi:hypothetical protein
VPDALYLAVRPMLAVSRGRLILLSTPYGKRGFFYEEWAEGEAWERYEVPASMCPRLSQEFLQGEMRKGVTYYEREYCCIFHEADMAAFRETDIHAAFAEEFETWDFLAGELPSVRA